MRDHSVHHGEELLLLLYVHVVDLVRHVDDLDENFAVAVLLKVYVGSWVYELRLDLDILLVLLFIIVLICDLEQHVVEVVA